MAEINNIKIINNNNDLLEILKIYFELGENLSKIKNLCLNKGVVKDENNIAIEDYLKVIKETSKELPVKGINSVFAKIDDILNNYSTGEKISETDCKKLLPLLSKLKELILNANFEIGNKTSYKSNKKVENLVKEIESYFNS